MRCSTEDRLYLEANQRKAIEVLYPSGQEQANIRLKENYFLSNTYCNDSFFFSPSTYISCLYFLGGWRFLFELLLDSLLIVSECNRVAVTGYGVGSGCCLAY